MKKEEIQLWDFKRILLGEAPLDFMLEVFIRTLVIFLILLIAMRLFGKRMSANNSILEMTVLILLGAIVSVPMQMPDRGMIPGVVILFALVFFYRWLTIINAKNDRAEEITMGNSMLLVKNGVINLDGLKRAVVSHEQLFGRLRGEGIVHLGQVKRVYLEGCGIFAIYRLPQAKPGLSVLPSSDEKLVGSASRSDDWHACKNCGNVEQFEIPKECSNCGENDWDIAVSTGVKEFKKEEHHEIV